MDDFPTRQMFQEQRMGQAASELSERKHPDFENMRFSLLKAAAPVSSDET